MIQGWSVSRQNCLRGGPGVASRVVLVLACQYSLPVVAQEIAPFRLTSVEGYVSTRSLADKVETSQLSATGRENSYQGQSNLRTEVFLMTHSYVYHPKFLSLDVGGGPLLDRQHYESDAGSIASAKTLYNFTGRATFLRDKALSGALFYDHLNPTVTLAPGLIMQQENTRYGFEAMASGALSPLPLRLAYLHQATSGRGADRSIDESSDQFTLAGSRSHGALGTTQFQYQLVQQESRSGSPALALQRTTSNSQGINIDTRLQFGSDRQYDLNNIISLNSRRYAFAQSSLLEQRDQNFMLEGRARHSSQFSTFAVYNHNANSQGGLDASAQSLAAGLNYLPLPELGISLNSRGEETENQIFSTRYRGLDGTLRYEYALPLGVLQASVSGQYFTREQQSVTPQAPVLGEHVLLEGLAYKTLAQRHVAVASLVVSNLARTQSYVEGIDYSLLQIGAETRIQRLPGGSILDGEEVLLDYSYDTGGSFAYAQFDRTYNLNWSVARYFNAYLRRFDATPVLTFGTSSFPLNTVHSQVVGARADIPFNAGIAFSIGGAYEQEDRRETISPYRRSAEDFYLQTDEPLFGLGNFRLARRRTTVDYDLTGQRLNLTGYDLRYWSRHWFGLEMSATSSIERDSALGVPLRRRSDALNAQWRERKLTVTASLVHTNETRGTYERQHTLLQMTARRDF